MLDQGRGVFSCYFFALKSTPSLPLPSTICLPEMLLYVGALTDLRPVMRFAHAHRVFIYVDGLPTSKYFTASDRMSSVKEIQQAMISDLERERAFLKIEDRADHFTIHTVGGQAIHYFHDTLDVQMFDNPRLATYLANVQALYMCGFFPKIIKPLPSLKRYAWTDFGEKQTIITFSKLD